VAAWLSETVLRGGGPGASRFESHPRGRIFSKEGTSAEPWMCAPPHHIRKKERKNKSTARYLIGYKKKKKCVTKLTRNNKISDIFLISANQPSNIKFLTLQTNPSFLISS
jgi:hypothetical protein